MMRIGLGYDLHRLAPERRLVIGGVEIPHEKGLLGHSDADVLTHAIIDALLGALALGDIGAHFPDTDRRYKDADSLALLRHVLAEVFAHGYTVSNLDTVVVAERPKLRPHIDAMRARLAETMQLPIEAVSVKAKTNEQVGPEGREEAISAQAIVLLTKAPR
jgi:2-C-methyl-D-erythritol 2,4-cyclodiphosphate synthase